MEDSERRRERLKAMRTVAAQSEASNNVDTSGVPGVLANPLLEASETASGQELCATPRFDFYTDPMAAFSANKKRTVTSSQVTHGYITPTSNCGSPSVQFSSPHPGPRNPEMTPPYHQMQSNYSSNQRMYQAQVPHYSPAPYRSPGGMSTPPPMHQRAPLEAWNGAGGTSSYYSSAPHRGMTCPRPMHQGNAGFGPAGSPNFNKGQGRAHWFGNSASPGSGHGASPSPSSGRGRGQWRGSSISPAFRQSGGSGSGRGGYSRGFAQDETRSPECFYNNSMVEDPWQHLEPVLWKGLDAPGSNWGTPGSSSSWLPKSISMKKPRVSEPSKNSTSQQSLAEYLATSFNEAVNDTSGA